MRSIVPNRLIAIAALVAIATYHSGLKQIVHAKSLADRFKTKSMMSRSPLPQIGVVPTVSPNSVSVDSQGATSVLLTYSRVINLVPLEATFCDALAPVFSGPNFPGGLGAQCLPGTSFGNVPQRYDHSTLSRNNTFTDILTITPAIARRGYLKAVRGNAARFFYVRRFRDSVNPNREVAVPVTITLSGNGAGVPLSLTAVKLKWGANANPILFVKTVDELPQVQAEITYTGTGRLKGRWELVKPGDVPPKPRELLTDASLPVEERGTQRRYTEMSKFNVYLPPTGKILLPGPEVERMDKSLTGLYQILLRIEATDDTQGVVPGRSQASESALAEALKRVPSGGVAGFSLPAIKYYVSNGSATPQPAIITSAVSVSYSPADQATLDTKQSVDFTWPLDNAVKYLFKIEDLQGAPVISAILPAGVTSYRAPSWLKDRVGMNVVRWRVVSLNQQDAEIERTEWRTLRFVSVDRKNQQP